jgi:hypothetical protein
MKKNVVGSAGKNRVGRVTLITQFFFLTLCQSGWGKHFLCCATCRLKQELSEDGQATLTITAAKPYDAGVYKCVARSKAGRASTRMRLLQGGKYNV